MAAEAEHVHPFAEQLIRILDGAGRRAVRSARAARSATVVRKRRRCALLVPVSSSADLVAYLAR